MEAEEVRYAEVRLAPQDEWGHAGPYTGECQVCFALVENTDRHTEWHLRTGS